MAKTRLNKTHRDMLIKFASNNIKIKERDAEDKAYEKAAIAVRKDFDKQFPYDDMLMLKKYGVAELDSCIRGADSEGTFIGFDFKRAYNMKIHENEYCPHTPLAPKRHCATRSIKFSISTVREIQDYELKQAQTRDAYEEKMRSYKALILASKTFEDVLAIWPAAAALSDKIGVQSTAVAALSEEAIAMIAEDNAGADQIAA